MAKIKRNYDKFQRWLERFKPEYLKYYEKGYNKGKIEIEEVSLGFHLYYQNELLGTLLKRF